MYTTLATITVGSHFFKLNRISHSIRPVLREFAFRYIKYKLVKVPRGGGFKRVPDAVFGAATEDREEYRFHINQYEEFRALFKERGYPDSIWQIDHKPVPKGVDYNLELLLGWVLRDYQEPIVDYLAAPLPIAKIVEIQPGKGKGQPLSSLIKVPGGWKKMGEIKVGTQVIAKDGTTTNVTGVFPQGVKDVYKFTFADGRTALCDDSHLWRVYYKNTSPHKRWRVVNTLEVKRLLTLYNNQISIDLCDSEVGSDTSPPLDPYVLGLLLGNGCFAGGSITYSTRDHDTIDRINKAMPEGITAKRLGDYNYRISGPMAGPGNELISILTTLGLYGTNSATKFIPSCYLHASTKQRQALLQGLMDSDGTANKLEVGGSISYCSVSQKLAEDVQYLIRSLGGIAKITSRIPTFTYLEEKKDGLRAYNVNIRVKNPSQLFTVERKKERTNDNNQYAKGLKLRIESVEFVGREETQCISIDHPDRLYVTNDFVVTHNTLSFLAAMARLKTRFAAIIRPMFIDKWVEDVQKVLNIQAHEVMVVKGGSNLRALIQLALTDQLTDIKAIIISNKTYQGWLTIYEKFREGAVEMGYGCHPEDFFEVLGCGVRMVDEVHLDLHLQFKLDLYTNVQTSIALSATFLSNDKFIEHVQKIMYPPATRYQGGPLDRYVTAIAAFYSIENMERIRTVENGGNMYSHNAFEKSIRRNPQQLANYCRLIKHYVDVTFMDDYKQGERCIVFCSSVEMCAIVRNSLSRSYPHLDIRRFVAEDPPENMLEPDIIVTTVLSGGTAHDVPKLKAIVQTITLDSIQSNIQAMGRLRNIPGMPLRFLYMVCTDVEKSMKYHHSKVEMLKERAKVYQEITSPFRV